MIKALKGVTKLLPTQALGKSAEVQKAKEEAAELIERELHMVLEKLKQVPEDRLPSQKIAKSITVLRDTVTVMMENVGKTLADVSSAPEIELVDDQRKRVTLERYSTLVNNSASLTPFATFYEIRKLVSEEDIARNSELHKAYSDAVTSLFTHATFEETLVGRMDKKVAILGQTDGQDNNMERKKVLVFLENYGACRGLNPKLLKNEKLEGSITELEAVVFLQNQTRMLKSGECSPTKEVQDFINHWSRYLSDLSADNQAKKMVLINVVNDCSDVFEACRQ